MTSLCSTPGFLRVARFAMSARPDIPRMAWVLAARHQHANYDAPGFEPTAEGFTALAVHYLVTRLHARPATESRARHQHAHRSEEHATKASKPPQARRASDR